MFTEEHLQSIVDTAKANPGPVVVTGPLKAFLDDECDFHEDYEEEANELYSRHKQWSKSNGARALSRNRLGTELMKTPGVGKRLHGQTRRVIYTGVRLRLFGTMRPK